MAQKHDVPRQTPQDRVLGRVVLGKKLGPPPYLTAVEKTEPSKFLVDVAKAGYGRSQQQSEGVAASVALDKGTLKGNRLSDGWFRRFMERQNIFRCV